MYVVNLSSHRIHAVPTNERCNMDQVKRKKKYKRMSEMKPKWRFCSHCFPPER